MCTLCVEVEIVVAIIVRTVGLVATATRVTIDCNDDGATTSYSHTSSFQMCMLYETHLQAT